MVYLHMYIHMYGVPTYILTKGICHTSLTRYFAYTNAYLISTQTHTYILSSTFTSTFMRMNICLKLWDYHFNMQI